MKTAHEAIAAMKAELGRRMKEYKKCGGFFTGCIGPDAFAIDYYYLEDQTLLSFLDTLEAEATPEKLVLKNELTGEVVVDKTIPEHMRGEDPEIACACMKLLSAGWTLIAPGVKEQDLEKEAALPKIRSWVARDIHGTLRLYGNDAAFGQGIVARELSSQFDELTTNDDPIEVELIVNRKK